MLLQLTVSCLLLAAVAGAAVAAAESRAAYYREIPAAYRAEFELQDRYSAVVRFARDVRLNATRGLGCPAGRHHFPLAAFQLPAEATADAGGTSPALSYAGFEASQRAGMSMANLLSYMYQLAGVEFPAWFQANVGGRGASGYDAFWYSIVSSVVASDQRVFGCYAVLLDGEAKPRDPVPHAYRNASDHVIVDSYSIDASIRPESVGFEWFNHHVKNWHRIVDQVSRRPSQTVAPNFHKQIFAFTAGLLKSEGGSVKVVTAEEGYWTPPVFVCNFSRWLVSYAVPFLNSAGDSGGLGIK